MLIAFVNPPILPFRLIMRNFDCGTESKGNYLYQPYDFLLMSARVPKEWDIVLIDAIADRLSGDEVHRRLTALAPDLVVLAMVDTNWKQDKEFLLEMRQLHPGTLTLVCGDSFLERDARTEVESHCDGIIDDPLTIDFVKTVEERRWQPGPAHLPGPLKRPREVDVGLPRHKEFLSPRYRWPFARHYLYTTIFTSWGCAHSCTYCDLSRFPNFWRPAEDVLREMAEVYRLGVREVFIGDRSFGLPRANVIKLLEGMVAAGWGFGWSAYFRPDQYDPELLELMAKSGCHTLMIGIDSANERNLARYGRRVTTAQCARLIEHSRRLGIEICGDFIIGLPGDSITDIEETIKLSKTLGIDYASFNVATPLPGSLLRTQAIASGKMKVEDRHFDTVGRSHVLGNDELSGETIRALRDRAVREFYLRPSYFIKRLRAVRSFSHFLIQAQEGLKLLR